MRCKIYSKKDIEEFSKTIDLKLPELNWKQIKKRERLLIRNKTKKVSRIQRYANQLNKQLPASEVWFQSLWPYKDDKFNAVLGKRIPDVMNKLFKYVIEIDGIIHQMNKQKRIDSYKNRYYKQKGYKIFRVVAYDIDSYNECLKNVTSIRSS